MSWSFLIEDKSSEHELHDLLKNASRHDILTRQKERENDQRLQWWNWTGSLSLFITRQQVQQIREEPENMEARVSVTGLLRWDVIRICHRILTFCSSHHRRTEELGSSNQADDEKGQHAVWAMAAHAQRAAPTREETHDLLYADMYLGQVNHFTAVGI